MMNTPRDERSQADSSPNPLSQLTSVPREAFDRAIAHGKDVAHSPILTVEDSQLAIAWAVREAMGRLEISIYHLHELTGLECDFIDKVIEGTADISDSEPISKIEAALRVRLTHL